MTWWSRLFRREQLDAQLERELAFHLEQHTADLIARGVDPAEARRRARILLGGPEQVKEQCRDARGTRWLEDLWQDFRYALRTLRRQPVFSGVGLATLALGAGATTVMFTVIDGVLLKPLPYVQPERLVRIQEQTDWSTAQGNLWSFSYPNFVDCRDQAASLQMAALRYHGGIVSSPGDAEYVDAYQISVELFSLLGISISQGRAFLGDEDRPGGSPVVIVSHSFWERRLGANPAAIGTRLVFDGQPRTIVGITPPGFRLEDEEIDLFTPIGQDTSAPLLNRERHGVVGWGRLQPGATLAEANAALAVIGRRLAAEYPKSNHGRTFIADPLRPDVAGVQATLWLLMGAVSMVLLIACANIASLLLARAVSRERELAMRAALGAGRGRLVRQCLTESAVLGISGGLLGILVAAAGLRPFVVFWPGTLPRAEQVHLDWRVLLFALGVGLASGLLFGLAPALRVPVRQLEQTLRAGGRTVTGSSRRLYAAFVITEVALATVLLVSAGLLGRTMLHLSALEPGMNTRNLLVARAALPPAVLTNPGATRSAWDDFLQRARRIPGVESAALVDTVPMRQGNNEIGYWTTPVEPPQDRQPMVSATSVTPDYFKVMGIALRQGRFFTSQDRLGGEGVVIIDDVMARQAFGTLDALGRHLWFGMGSDPVRVVGVVGHVRYWGPAGDDQAKVRAQLYYPFAQVPDQLLHRWSELMSVAVRARLPPLSLVPLLRHEIVLYETSTMEQLAAAKLARQRFLSFLFAVFAGLALLLASVGIYGVLAYLTSRRAPEIGVRMALGARSGDVLWLVLRQSLTMILLGVGIGAAAAVAAARILEHSVEGAQPAGLAAFAITLPLLVAAALFASFLPARRATRLDVSSLFR